MCPEGHLHGGDDPKWKHYQQISMTTSPEARRFAARTADQVLRQGFTRTFWVANVLELFERFAFYGSRRLAVYLNRTVGLSRPATTSSAYGDSSSACRSSRASSSTASGSSAASRVLLDLLRRYSLALARMPAGRPSWTRSEKGYVVLALVVTAIGGSLIKPCIVGTVARTTTERRILGYSIYYTLVNFGGFLGDPREQVGIRWGIAEVLSCPPPCRPGSSSGRSRSTRTRGPARARSRRSSRTALVLGTPLHQFLVIFLSYRSCSGNLLRFRST